MGCASSKAALAEAQGVQADSQEAWLKNRQHAAQQRTSSRNGSRSHHHALQPGIPVAAAASGLAVSCTRQPSSSLGSSDSESEVASDWDRYSWHPEPARSEGALVPPSPSFLGPRDTVDSFTLSGSLSGQLRIRQDSLFGLSCTPLLAPIKDSGRLRLCKVSGCTFVNQYMVIKYLGRGSSGRVFLCMGLDDYRLYAVKIVRKDQAGQRKAARSGVGRQPRDPLEDLRREIAVMRRAVHPNVVALREVVDDSGSNKMLLVMDYFEGGPVMTREGLERGHRVPEDVARLYFRDMCKALDYLHCDRRVIHGDLKPENALMGAAGRVALSDFGCSKVLSDADAEFDRCNGTPAFLAPEMMRPNARYRGRPADVYALGGCLYAFIFGKIPFKADTVLQLFSVVQSTPLSFPTEPAVSQELRQLLLGMLEKDPERRLTLAQVMAHPWMTAGGALPPLRSCLDQPQQLQPQGVIAAAAGGIAGGAFEAQGNGMGSHLHQQQQAEAGASTEQQQQHFADAGQADGEDQQQQQEERDRLQQEQLLKDALQGLVAGTGNSSGGLQVLSFAAGERLMARGQAGAHLLYILEGECEVHYRTAPPPSQEAQSQPQAQSQSQVSAATPPAAGGTAGDTQGPQEQQVERQASLGSRGEEYGGGAVAAASSRRSAAGLFAGASDGGNTRPGSADPAGFEARQEDEVASSSISAQPAPTAQERQQTDTLCSRRNSSYLAETQVAAASDMDLSSANGSATGPARQEAASKLQRWESTASSAPPVSHQRQPSGRDIGDAALPLTSAGSTSLPPLPPGRQQRSQSQQQRQLSISIPASESEPEFTTPRPAAASSAASSGAATPPCSTPEGAVMSSAAAAAAATPSPGPYGLHRHMGLDVEGAAAHLYSPSPAAASAAAAGPAQGGAAAGAGEAVSAADGQQGSEPQHARHQGHSEPEVVGEELPPTLLEASTRAKELLDGLRRGAGVYLVARRGPGDFVGEMEALNGSQSRRVATVVASSSSVQAALIPYPAAKAYLSRHPLAKQQLAQLMWLRQSEDIVLEALARLAALGDDMLRLLQPATSQS